MSKSKKIPSGLFTAKSRVRTGMHGTQDPRKAAESKAALLERFRSAMSKPEK